MSDLEEIILLRKEPVIITVFGNPEAVEKVLFRSHNKNFVQYNHWLKARENRKNAKVMMTVTLEVIL